MTEADILKQIDRLESERAQFIRQAELQIAVFDGGIQALRQLLTPDAPPPTPAQTPFPPDGNDPADAHPTGK